MFFNKIIENIFFIKYNFDTQEYNIFFDNKNFENDLGFKLYANEQFNKFLKHYPNIFQDLKHKLCLKINYENDRLFISQMAVQNNIMYSFAYINSLINDDTLQEIKFIDSLTGLLNKDGIYEKKLEKNKYIALIEIKNFNELLISNNDDLNEIITSFAEFLSAFFINHTKFIARIDNNQFLLVLNTENKTEVKALIEEFLHAVMKMNIRVTVAIVKYDNIENAHKKGLAVIEWNKEHHLNYSFYEDVYINFLKHKYDTRMLIIDTLRHNNFDFYFQPYYDIKKNKIVGAEALLRIYDSNGNIISPAKFIDLAEKSGLIQEIEEKVINLFLKYVEKIKDMHFSYNLSAISFSTDYVKKLFKNKLNEKITIEITERIMLDINRSKENIDYIRSFGSKVSIDDYGTGYSSLSNLLEYNIDIIKIDMMFIKNITTNKKNYYIVKNTINLAKDLGKETICEGVETKDQFLELKQLGCDMIQGYFISKPMPFDEFKKFIKEFKIEY